MGYMKKGKMASLIENAGAWLSDLEGNLKLLWTPVSKASKDWDWPFQEPQESLSLSVSDLVALATQHHPSFMKCPPTAEEHAASVRSASRQTSNAPPLGPPPIGLQPPPATGTRGRTYR